MIDVIAQAGNNWCCCPAWMTAVKGGGGIIFERKLDGARDILPLRKCDQLQREIDA